ncbi:MAG: single-stranded DNA-binding protein [Spirochaetales bacterium]|nr:single-stranded DNA-binding protein [Spirochaetales bacterium]
MSLSPLVKAARELANALDSEDFLSSSVAYVYNPLTYAREPHETYLTTYGSGNPRFLFLGMNPGPWGMAQTGVPFGEVDLVRSWLQITGTVRQPANTHPKKPVGGFSCSRSEVSGRRLWGLMKNRFGVAVHFFHDHFVANYCPLLFLDEHGRNITPDKLPKEKQLIIEEACNTHLTAVVETLQPQSLIGVGTYAEKKLKALFGGSLEVLSILHPSPASPRANRGWEEEATKQLIESGVWAS